jgi:hypothetical protein
MPMSFGERLPSVNDIRLAAGFLSRLPRFLHHTVTPEQAKQIIRERLRTREQTFLQILRNHIFGYAHSPYLSLMQNAGIEMGDIENMLAQEGLDGTLLSLLKAGIYLSVDEFKGRKAAVRGSRTIETNPLNLRNPKSEFHIPVHSGGSRSGKGTPVMIDLAYVRDSAVNMRYLLHLHGGDDWLAADWEVPGGGALFRLLKFSQFANNPVKWFSQLDPASPELHPRYRFSGTALRWISLAALSPMPPAEYVPLDNPAPIARWMSSVRAQGKTPLLWTFPSSAVRVCRAALDGGIDISGARFFISGEPITASRTATINSAGCKVIPRYGTIETGPIGYCCMRRQGPDDLHVQRDLHALIQAGDMGLSLGLPTRALFISNLRPSAPYVMLNVSLGDEAELGPAECGCPTAGIWEQSIRSIRSFEKLTGAGMNFLDTDVVRVLEEVLPQRFGGAPTDYQLLEKEDADGVPRLHLLIRPSLGPIDEAEAARVFLDGLNTDSGASVIMGLTWEKAGILRIERQAPHMTASGKILHLHLAKPLGDGSGENPVA